MQVNGSCRVADRANAASSENKEPIAIDRSCSASSRASDATSSRSRCCGPSRQIPLERSRRIGSRMHRCLQRISNLPDADFLREVCDRYNAIPSLALEDADLMASMLPILRAVARVIESYRPQPARPLSCAIMAFSGSRDRTLSVSAVGAWRDKPHHRSSMSFWMKVTFICRAQETI